VLLIPTVLATKPEHVTGRLDYRPFPIFPIPAKMSDGNVFLNTWEEGDKGSSPTFQLRVQAL